MLPILLSLASSIVYGAADFMGGVAAKRVRALVVVAVSQLAGFALVLALAPLLGGTVDTPDLGIGAAAGAVGALALTLFYRALATSPMAGSASPTPTSAGTETTSPSARPATTGTAAAQTAVTGATTLIVPWASAR